MYQTLASDYDRFNNWEERLAYEMPFILTHLPNMMQDPAQAITLLDAACGTGMHALNWPEAGFEVAGADLFEEMILKARDNALQASATVDFRIAGFSNLVAEFAPRRFDALISSGNSLPHLLSADAVMRALQEFSACLNPGGLAAAPNSKF